MFCAGLTAARRAAMNDLKLYGLKLEHIQKLLDAIHTVRFGTVTAVIQDGSLIQLEQHEKIRLK